MSPTFISLVLFGLSLGQAMEVHNGSLSKPHLQALPAPVVVPGGDVTLQCSMPMHSYPKARTFILQKGQNMEPLQMKPGEGTKVDFCLFSLRPQDTGNYSCIYRETTGSYRVSEPSEPVELWVTDILHKPFLSATPSQLVVSGGNVTLLCWGPIRGVRFALYKQGEESFVSIRESTEDRAAFPLTHVNITNMGNYSCCYYLGQNSSLWSPSSDLLELRVQSEQDTPSQHTDKTQVSRNILIILSCISVLFLLLVAFVVHQHTQTVTSHGQIPRRFPDCLCPSQHCFSYNPGSPQEESAYIQIKEWRQRVMAVPQDEDPQESTYIQLNKGILNEAQIGFPSKPQLEPTLYATVAMHHGAEQEPSLQSECVIYGQGRRSNQK